MRKIGRFFLLKKLCRRESDTLLELEDSVQKRKKEHGKGAKEDEILEGNII